MENCATAATAVQPLVLTPVQMSGFQLSHASANLAAARIELVSSRKRGVPRFADHHKQTCVGGFFIGVIGIYNRGLLLGLTAVDFIPSPSPPPLRGKT